MKTLDPDSMPKWLANLWPIGEISNGIIAGINDDDCAVLRLKNSLLVITTDYINSCPISIELGIGNLRTLGRLVVASNLADLCSSGARPEALLAGITMPRGSTTEEFKQLMKGVKYESHKWDVPVIGGDTKLGGSLAVLGVGVGSAPSRKNLFLKNQAKAGDLLWVSGNLGSCSAAVLGLKDMDLSSSLRKWAINSLVVPDIPIRMSSKLSDSGLGHGGIDVSDGLGEDLSRLSEASGTGVILDVNRIPVDRNAKKIARDNGLPPWSLAFSSGGEFQFLVTTSERVKDRISGMGFTPIGRIVRGRKKQVLLDNGKLAPLPRTGHRDVRNISFHDEISKLAKEAARVALQV